MTSQTSASDNQKGCVFLIVVLFFVVIIIYTCSDGDSDDIKEEEKQIENTEIPITRTSDLSMLRERLPSSNYFYSIRIVNIEFMEIKNAYLYKADKYSVGDSVSGIKLIVTYSMTNPYNKEMVDVAIPMYYELSADEDLYGSAQISPIYDKREYSRILMYDGKEITRSDYMLSFNSNEAKEFKVIFPPFIYDVPKVVFWGFSDSTNQSDMKWGWAQNNYVEIGIEIDVRSNKILSQLRRQSWNRTEHVVQKIVSQN